MRSFPSSGTPRPMSPAMNLPISDSYSNPPSTQSDSYFNTPPIPTPTSPVTQTTSQVHIITCQCHSDLLLQTVQSFATSNTRSISHNNNNTYTYQQHITPPPPLTIRDLLTAILPFSSQTSKLLAYTLPQPLNPLITTISTLSNPLTNILAPLISPFSSAILPCLPPSRAQLYATLKKRIYLYLLGNNLFALVLIEKMYAFYLTYCSWWVVFNLVSLPITFGLGVVRMVWEVMEGLVWGPSGLGGVLSLGSRSVGLKVGTGCEKEETRAGRKSEAVGDWKVEDGLEEEFLVVDLD